MPPVVAAVAAVGSAVAAGAAAAGGALASAAGFASFGALATSVVTNTLIATGLSFAMQALSGKPKEPEFPDLSAEATARTRMIRTSVGNRRVIYGTVPVSGVLIFAATTDKGSEKDRYLHLVIPLAGHEVNAISTVWFNDTEISESDRNLSTGEVTSGDYANKARIKIHLGSTAQAADTDLVSEVSNWTSNHRLRGIAYIYVRLEWDQDVYQNGIPNIKALVQGKKLFDLRDSTISFGNNPALCIYDYLVNSYGLNADSNSEIDSASFIAAANTCDENVNLAAGGTQKRYTCDGVIDLGKKPVDIIEEMLTSCGGALTYEQGTYKLFVAAATSSSKSLNEDDLLAPIKVRTKPNRKEIFNAVRGIFINPDDDYQPTDFPIRTNSTYEAQDNNEQIVKDVQFPFTTNSVRAQRLAEINLQRSRQGISVEFPVKMGALDVSIWDVVDLSIAKLGWVNKEFRVVSWILREEGGILLTLQEEANVYNWTPGTDEITIDPAPDTNLPSAFLVEPPVAVTLSDSLVTLNNGEIVTQLDITIIPSPNSFVVRYEVQLKPTSGSTWQGIGFGNLLEYNHIGVLDGSSYDVRARAINARNVRSAWVQSSRQIVGKTAPPSNVTNFSLNIVRETAYFTWDAVTDADLDFYKIRWSPLTSGATYEDAITIVPKVAKPATSISIPAQTGTFFIKSVDTSGISSTTASEITAIIDSIKDLNVIQTETEHTAFLGTHNNTTEVDGSLVLDTTTLFDSGSGNFDDALGLFDGGEGSVAASGDYIFQNTVDLGAKYTSRVTANVTVVALDYSDSFDGALGNFDDREGLFEGDSTTAVKTDAKLQISVTDDDPTGAPTWSAWRDFTVGDYRAWGLRFRVVLTSENGDQTPRVDALSVTVDMPDRIEAAGDVISGTDAGGKVITFSPSYKSLSAVGITAQDLQQGDYWTISSKSSTGFTIKFFDSVGTVVSRTFDWTAKGYGELAS